MTNESLERINFKDFLFNGAGKTEVVESCRRCGTKNHAKFDIGLSKTSIQAMATFKCKKCRSYWRFSIGRKYPKVFESIADKFRVHLKSIKTPGSDAIPFLLEAGCSHNDLDMESSEMPCFGCPSEQDCPALTRWLKS